MKKALSLTLVLIGAALLITAVVFWIDSRTSTESPSLGKTLLDWVTFIAGLGASVKGWVDLSKKEARVQRDTNSGMTISGTVESVGRDLIGNQVFATTTTTNIVAEDDIYHVEGRRNPYLGLQAFTYDERDRYAGREMLTREALQLLVSPGEQRNLLFITGASGSGKSSFVQASLLPALIHHYEQKGETVQFEVIRPFRNPGKRLKEAIKHPGSKVIQVIVIDQFEELFTQSDPGERKTLIGVLKKLRPFEKERRYILCTLRSDYLGEMFDIQWLWEIAKRGVELREMQVQELKKAILQPIQVNFPNGEKRMEAQLVEKLATDASENVSLLPLLQVTLEEIWNKGHLRLGAYNLLTDAIKERADTVLAFQDFDRVSPASKRTQPEREEILSVLLDLVNPSLGTDLKHDVRVSRRLSEFNARQRELLRELSSARLVSIEVEDGVEVVNLIHEALIRSWDVLSNGINQRRLELQKRVRFEELLRVWIANKQADDFLLSKGQYAEAQELERNNDIALGTQEAGLFLKKSEAKIERETKHEELLAAMEKRVYEMNTLTRVSQGVNITQTLDDILELIYAQTTQVLPASIFHITLYNKGGNYFYYAFLVDDNERLANRENQPLQPHRGLGAEIVRKGHPILAPDYGHECQTRNITPSVTGVYAWMGVPLNSGAETMGALSIGSRDSTLTYTRDQLDLLQAIADQTIGAIVKARLLQETQQRAHQLSTLNEITRQLTSTLEQEPLLRNILENAVAILNCEAGSLFLMDEPTGDLIFRVTVGPVATNLLGQRVPAGTGVVGRAVQLRSPVIENDGRRSITRHEGANRETGFISRSLLAVPMQIKDRVLGVIEVINRRDGLPFVEDDQNLLTAFAGQAAIAIENARLLAQTDQDLAEKVEELQVMGRIDRELNASLEVARAMHTTLEWAMRRSNAEAGLIGMIEGDHLRLMAQQGFDDIFTSEGEVPVDLDSPVFRSALQSGQPSQISLVGSDTKGILPNAHTQLIVPIRRETRVIGLLLLEITSDSQGNLSFLSQLSNSAAIAITNAQLYDEVQRANLAKSEYVNFLAHELKNPMVSIKGYTELLATGSVGQVNEMQVNFLNTIRSNVGRISTLVSDLNDDSKIEAGRLRLDYNAIKVDEVLDEAVRSLRRAVEDKRQTVEIQIPPNLPLAWGDRIRLNQILMNLVSNAHKYSAEGSNLLIGAEVADNKWDPEGARKVVHMWVNDNGIGISIEDQTKIFQKFFRSDDSKAREVPGTGLGLNITKSLVEMMGGRIWFESEYRQGTTFHFTIPITEG